MKRLSPTPAMIVPLMALLVSGPLSCSSPSQDASAPAAEPTPVENRPAAPEPATGLAAGAKHPVAERLLNAGRFADAQDNATIDLLFDLREKKDAGEEKTELTYRLLLGEGYKFALAPTGKTLGYRVHANGNEMVAISPMPQGSDDRYMVRHGIAAYTTTRQVRSVGFGLGSLILSLLSELSTDRLMEFSSDFKDLGTESITVGGETVSCQRSQLLTGDLVWDVWVEAGDAPRVRRIVPDLSEPGEAKPADELTIDIVSWDSKTPVAKSAFYTASSPHPLLGKKVPSVTLPLLEGGTARLSDQIGKKVIILDFWATNCPLCILGMPTLEKVTAEYADRGVVAYAVNAGEDPEMLKPFLAEQGWSLPVALDRDASIGSTLKIGNGLPTSLMIGLDGTVQIYSRGIPQDQDLYREKLKEEVEELLAGKSPAADQLKQWRAMKEAFAAAE